MLTRKIIESQHRAQAHGILSMWTIFDHPDDFPYSYIARRFEVANGGAPRATDDIVQGELSILREGFALAGLVCLARNDEDNANVVETWL